MVFIHSRFLYYGLQCIKCVVIKNISAKIRLNSYNTKDGDDENENKPHYHKN